MDLAQSNTAIEPFQSKDIVNTFEKIEQISQSIDLSLTQANEAKRQAQKTRAHKVSWCKGKVDTIKSLQETACSQAEAIINVTQAQSDMFQGIKAISANTQKLFYLGIMNQATTRSVINCLRQKMQMASEGKLNEYALEELKHILTQLEVQEDNQNKLSRLAEKNRELQAQIQGLSQTLKALQETGIRTQSEKVFVENYKEEMIEAVQADMDRLTEQTLNQKIEEAMAASASYVRLEDVKESIDKSMALYRKKNILLNVMITLFIIATITVISLHFIL